MPRKVERPFNSGRWTRSRYFGFIRSALRYASRKWQPRNEALNSSRRPVKRPGRQKWEFQCAMCKKWFARKEVEVDHIVECGRLSDYKDLPVFVKRMFCEVDGFRVLCSKCHKARR